MAEANTETSHGDALIFSAKAAVSAVVSLVLFNLTGLTGGVWAAVSAVIVTQPSMHPSVKASYTRVMANLIGAGIGAVMGILFGHQLVSLGVGILVTGMVCHFTKLDEALRPAYAAVVIVILSADTQGWKGSLYRVLAVIFGCVCALAVGFICDKAATMFKAEREGTAEVKEGDE
jgi:uncharacterized membrane protein YgaE (UPF0421/DUF939 family)